MSKKGGHHGGAWKVAYADFVTAMMALFLVLWLTAQDQKLKEAVERAFRHPFMSLTKESAGIVPNPQKNVGRGSSGKHDDGTASAGEISMLRRLQADLAKSLKEPEAQEETVQFQLTPEGLRINIFDRGRRPSFEPDTAKLTEYGAWVLSTLAWEIARYPGFAVDLEGHTERGRQPVSPQYGTWELSADRANAGRRKLLEHGVRTTQVRKVAGFADTVPMPDHKPEDPTNRRLSLLLRVNPQTGAR
jgi:chemotaxis protein MotB